MERCPQHTECCYCNSLEECGNKRILTTSVFDLINRIQDEKQALINGQETLQNTIVEQKAEIERLKNNIDGLNIFTTNHIKVIRLQAMKEFAKRLKDELHRAKVEISKHFDYMDEATNESLDVFADSLKIKLNRTIDNLVKEMKEVETNQRKEDEKR